MKIRYYGHLGSPTGYGRAASHTCMALLSAGAELEIRPLLPAGMTTPELDIPMPLANCLRQDVDMTSADVIIVHSLPMDCPTIMRKIHELHPASPSRLRACVAYTTWEALSMPVAIAAELESAFDQIWVPSWATLGSLGKSVHRTPTPSVVIPHAYDHTKKIERKDCRSRPYNFVWFGAWNSRKNPIGLLRAYAHEFSRTDDVNLHIHSSAMAKETLIQALGSTGIPMDRFPSISFSNEHRLLDSILEHCDCFVTAARGEAWNLPAFEAAFLAGAQVIAPKWQGSDTYLAPGPSTDTPASLGGTRARLYASHPSPAWCDVQLIDGGVRTTGAQGLDSKSRWLEPDLVHLASQMRNAYEKRERDMVAFYDPVERFGYEAIGRLMMKTLEQQDNT